MVKYSVSGTSEGPKRGLVAIWKKTRGPFLHLGGLWGALGGLLADFWGLLGVFGALWEASWRVFGASWEASWRPQGVGLVRGRIQSGLPLTSGADPSCSPDCQDQAARPQKGVFADMRFVS